MNSDLNVEPKPMMLKRHPGTRLLRITTMASCYRKWEQMKFMSRSKAVKSSRERKQRTLLLVRCLMSCWTVWSFCMQHSYMCRCQVDWKCGSLHCCHHFHSRFSQEEERVDRGTTQYHFIHHCLFYSWGAVSRITTCFNFYSSEEHRDHKDQPYNLY